MLVVRLSDGGILGVVYGESELDLQGGLFNETSDYHLVDREL